MPSFTSTLLGWLFPSRSKVSGPMCCGTAQQVACRFVSILDLRDGYYTAILQQHLVMVIYALRATGRPVTKYNVVRFAHPHRLEVLHGELHRAKAETVWLGEYLDDLTADMRRAITQMYGHLSARFELADVPGNQDGVFRNGVRELGGSLVDLLQEVAAVVSFVVVWVETIAIWSGVFWVAFNDLGVVSLVGRPALSLEQCLGLGLLTVFLFNELTGRTDALASRVVNRLASRL